METNESEEWRVSPSFPSYDVSSHGRVRRNVRKRGWRAGHISKQQVLKNGYAHVSVSRDNKRYTKLTHSLIAEAFIGPRPPGYDINHKDMNRINNFASNLEYCSRTENLKHAYKLTGGHNGIRKSIAKLTEDQVHRIRRLRAAGHTLESIAQQVGTNGGAVRNIIYRNGFAWLSTPDEVADAGDVLWCDFAMQRDA